MARLSRKVLPALRVHFHPQNMATRLWRHSVYTGLFLRGLNSNVSLFTTITEDPWKITWIFYSDPQFLWSDTAQCDETRYHIWSSVATAEQSVLRIYSNNKMVFWFMAYKRFCFHFSAIKSHLLKMNYKKLQFPNILPYHRTILRVSPTQYTHHRLKGTARADMKVQTLQTAVLLWFRWVWGTEARRRPEMATWRMVSHDIYKYEEVLGSPVLQQE